ncbi:MAG: hydrogenase 4 subunit B, partial [Bacillota bacterium]|nr:hydrogenase 4 subunit B [Bacillota bacterium]
AIFILVTNQPISITAWTIFSDVELRFRVDSLSAFFLLVIAIGAVAVSIYSIGYVTEYYGKKPVGLLGGGLNIFLLSMVAVVTVDNSLTFLISWELMSIVSFFLVMFEHEKQEIRSAGYVYVVMTHFGTLFIILSFLTLFFFTKSLDFNVFALAGQRLPDSVKSLVFLMSLIGFGTKAGMVPLHIWLPRAHPAAPSHVSALMSAVMIKTAVYGLLRVIYDFLGAGESWWGAVLVAFGVISALLGILFGLAENDIKRFLAYSSAENMGIIFIGLGSSLLFYSYHQPLLGALALTALLYHVLNHAVFKGLLFMGAGSILYSTHSKNINQLGGLIRKMPWTAAFFLIGGMALASLPPLNGFMSEWATIQSLLHLSFSIENPVWKVLGGLAAALLGLTGAFVAGGVVKHFGTAFLGMPRTSHAKMAKEVPVSMRIGMMLLSISTFVLGVWPGAVLRITKGITERYFHQSLTGNAMLYVPYKQSAESISLGGVFIIFAVLLGLLILGLRIWVGSSRNQYDETWNCGTPLQPTMGYTGTSFSHPVLMIFKKLYKNNRSVDVYGEYRYFPKKIRHRLQNQSLIETTLYRPIIGITVFLSKRFRAIQNGNLQSYLAYMVITLILLLLLMR